MLGKIFGKKKSESKDTPSPNKKESSKDFKKDETKELEAKWSKIYANLDSTEKQQLETMRSSLAQLVLMKILGNPQMREKVKDRLKEAAIVFSSPAQMKQLYLNTNWAESFKIYQQKFATDDDKESKSTKGGINFSSKSSETEVEDIITEDMNKEFQELDVTFKQVKVKLVIAEVSHTSAGKTFRKLISPVLSKFDVIPEFGMFHSALMIGPWMIDWNDSGICIPRKCVSQAALISADIDTIGSEHRLDEVVDALADVICDWNAHVIYKDQSKREKNEGNCQDFVNAILEKLDVKIELEGPLGSFLKKLRNEGKCKIQFEMDSQFRDYFGIKEKTKEFKTHQELDSFVNELVELDVDFQKNYKDHWALLKSFDRAFWLKHFKFKNDEKFNPEMDGDEENCPFGDPHESGSIVDQSK
eukprot:gene9178-1266_t